MSVRGGGGARFLFLFLFISLSFSLCSLYSLSLSLSPLILFLPLTIEPTRPRKTRAQSAGVWKLVSRGAFLKAESEAGGGETRCLVLHCFGVAALSLYLLSLLFHSLSLSLSLPHRNRLQNLVTTGSFSAAFLASRREPKPRPWRLRGAGEPSGEDEEEGGMKTLSRLKKKLK